MWKSKDLALVIILAITSFIYAVFVGQLGNMITGIMGFNYFFVIGHAILISLSFLIYEGRRWRFLMQTVLVALLTLPTFMTGMPFDLLSKWPSIVGGFFVDLVFNSLYSMFINHKRSWAFLSVFGFFLTTPFLAALNMFFFYPSQVFAAYVNTYIMLLPITIIEIVIGSFIGYKIYQRVNKPMN